MNWWLTKWGEGDRTLPPNKTEQLNRRREKVAKETVVAGFTKVKSGIRNKRLVVAVEGREKDGKTSFALSAPAPIAIFNLDTGLEGVVEKLADEKEIIQCEVEYRDATNQNEWTKMWEQIKKNYYAALKSNVRTLVMDTASEMWELVRLARFGKLTQVMPHHYGPVNTEFRDLIRAIYKTDKNLILLHKLKDEYINDKKTGKFERAGFKDVAYQVQVNLRVWRKPDEDEEPKRRRGGGVALTDDIAHTGNFGFTIIDCRQDASLAGVEMVEPLNTFSMLAQQVYPETTDEDWE